MRLILVRHGQTTSNVAGRLDTGAPGAPLTALGHEQAAAVPRALAHERIDVVYASTLLRTQQTAEPLLRERDLELVVREGIREVSAGDLEMRADADAVRTYMETVFGWGQDLHRRMPGGESGAEVLARYDQVVTEVAGSGARTAVLFSHEAVIRTWAASRARNLTAAHGAAWAVSNTGAVVLEGSPDAGWHVLTWEGAALGGPAVGAPAQDGPLDGAAPDPHRAPADGRPRSPLAR